MRRLLTALAVLSGALACAPRRPGPLVVAEGDDAPVKVKTKVAPRVEDTGEAPCADDSHEPDDTPAQVVDRVMTGVKPVRLDNLVSCPGNDDHFHGFRECCGEAGALVTWSPEEGDLRVDFLDASGNRIDLDGDADSTSRDPGKVKLLKGNWQGDFYLRVRNRGGTRVQYRIEVYAGAE